MVGQASSLTPSLPTPSVTTVPSARLAWAQTPSAIVARIAGGMPDSLEWRRFLDQLRPSSKPLVLVLTGRIWLGSEARTALARAIGTSSVALVVDHDIGRGLATALRWMGSQVHAFELSEIDRIDAALGLEPGAALGLLQRLTR